jgi:NSS family neurotransmitter:Na+ symporter
MVFSMPCILGFNVWSSFTLIGKGIMDLEDFAVSNFLLPLGSLVYVLFCVSRYGWGWDKFMKEANTGKGLKVASWMRGYMTVGIPLMILVIFVMGLIG